MKIALSIFNGHGTQATLEDNDDGEIVLFSSGNKSVKRACNTAAKKLRDAADKFERLASMDKPFNVTTHNKINKGGA